MSSTIVIPQEFSYVAAAVVATGYLNIWQASVVGRMRKRAGIKYPQTYAENAEVAASKDAMKFNCAQRAHQNTLENLPHVLSLTLITGLKYPIPAAAACAFWTLSRVMYTLGYVSGDPAKRNSRGGFSGGLSVIGMLLASTWVAVDWVRSGL